MPELQRVDLATVRKLCGDNYANGLDYFKKGAVTGMWRSVEALHGQVAGSAAQPYVVSAGPKEDGSFWAKCSCPAARRQPICKHATALLVAWAVKSSDFSVHEEPEAPADAKGGPKLESDAKRVRVPKIEKRDLIKAGLEKAETLLVDLASQGLTSATREQAETVSALAETLEAHKMRRLAREVAELGRVTAQARAAGSGFDEIGWARLLSDTWFTLVATKKALAREDEADRADLEELVGKTWLEKDLRRVENLLMVEVGYETQVLSSGFRVETSFLLDLGDGTLYTEKQITPLMLKDAPKKRSYAEPMRIAAAGIYPGFAPYRIKLIGLSNGSDASDLSDLSYNPWDRAIELAETSAVALRQRLTQSTASLVAPQEVYSLFRPASIVVDDEHIHLLDSEGKAIPIGGDGQAAAWALRDGLRQGPVAAVLIRVRFGGSAMEAEPLSAVLREGTERLVRLAG